MTAEQAPLVMDPAVTLHKLPPSTKGRHPRVAEPRFLYATEARGRWKAIPSSAARAAGGFGEASISAVSDAGKEVAIKLIRRNLDVELQGASRTA